MNIGLELGSILERYREDRAPATNESSCIAKGVSSQGEVREGSPCKVANKSGKECIGILHRAEPVNVS